MNDQTITRAQMAEQMGITEDQLIAEIESANEVRTPSRRERRAMGWRAPVDEKAQARRKAKR